jgi:hypothetical protein
MLSNTTQNALRTQPYYDDFYNTSNTDPSLLQGEVNDFHRILFRPRFPVQSRELTQLQTILQAQLERFGKSSFRNGEAVIGGQLTLDTSVMSGKVLPTTNIAAFFDRTDNDGKFVFDTVNVNARAHVLQYAAGDEEGFSDNYLLFKYQSAGVFSPATVVQAADDAQVTGTFASGAAVDVFNTGSIISIDEGVFFVSGFFVRVPKQTIVLNPFTAHPSYRIGLAIQEQIIDELDETVGESLLDPANQNAPGAHRLRLTLTLAKRGLTTSADPAFIELARVIDGVIQKVKEPPRYVRIDELMDILARRTFDESGDYIVKPFAPVIEDDPETEDHFVLALGPGKAYVKGFEAGMTEPTKLQIRKGRASANVTNRELPARVGNFVYAVRVAAAQPASYFANVATVDIHCANIASINTASNTVYQYSKIGDVKVRMIETFSVPSDPSLAANNAVYKLFFYDANWRSLTGNLVSASANGLAITCVAALGPGLPGVNTAIENATIILGGNQSPVSGTFTVNNYVANVTHAFVTLREFIPTLPNANTTYKLLFQSKDIDAFALYDNALTTAQAPLVANLKFQADVDTSSKSSRTPVGNTIVSDATNGGLLYQIPERFIVANTMTTNTAIFTSWVKTTSNAQTLAATNTNFTLTVSGTGFTLPTGSLSATAAQSLLVVFDQTADANGRGRVLQFADTPGSTKCLSNVSIVAAGADYNITFTLFNATIATTRSLVGLAKTTVVGLQTRQKTLIVGNTTHAMSSNSNALYFGQIEFHTLNAAANFAYSLKTADAFNIRKVLYKSVNTAFANTDMSTATDVTNLFTLEDGQRDNSYEYSRLIAGQHASTVVRPTGRLMVVFDWFEHNGRGYVTADSYLSSTNQARGMTYDTIPDYTSAKLGNAVINLRDVLDFRPVRSNFDFTSQPLVFAASDSSSNTSYLTLVGDPYLIPVSDESWLGSYSYYLARTDKVALGFDGVFRVIEGQDAVTPVPPADSDGSLLMFQLKIPPYTVVDGDGVPTGVVLTTFDHKRFTMQDLSKMDDRVAHLEYYTALNSLEQITRDQSIVDASGNERFKNGILVDSFHGGDVADITRADYTASIDQQKRELRTAFRTFVMQFAADLANSTSTGVVVRGDMAIPTFTTTPFITQPLATHAISVNPFDVASFYGTVKLSPAVDIWKETSTQPAQVIDLGGPSESWVKSENPSFVNWGEWDQTWSGVVGSRAIRQYAVPPGWEPYNHPVGSMAEISLTEVDIATTYQRQGTAYEYDVTSSTASLGNRVVDVSVIHWMRARDVVFSGDGLKPHANVYPFFDGTAVINYTQQGNQLELEEQSSSGTNPFYIGQTVYVQKAVTGKVASVNGNTSITGTNTVFQFETVPGALVRVSQGVDNFDRFVSGIVSNTSLTLSGTANVTLSNATLYTLTPVTVLDIALRYSGNTVLYTLKVGRADRDADADSVVPYPITAGSLRPEKHVNDLANTTTGAVLLIPNSPRSTAAVINVTGADCRSGVVRSWDSANAAIRFDNDINDDAVSTPGTRVYFVKGPGQGTSATILSYNAATQTAVLNTSGLDLQTGVTIYSVGVPQTDGLIANNVVQGRAGTVAGVFHLPMTTFAVGTRNFRLTDNANNTTADATTAAETSYEASGLAYTQQETSVSSRQLGLRRAGPRTDTFTVTNTVTTGYDVQYIDPLAETFLVDAKQFPQGVFIDSVDLCFKTVPTDDIPVTVQIRPVVNGYPSANEIVPCVSESGIATVTLRPDQCRTSDIPSFDSAQTQAVTNFRFTAPVHLMPGKEYALVVISDSNDYTVYTAELGQTTIGSTGVVAKQPYAGSFFKSQNAQTWTESPFEDMMFRLNRAVWNATEESPLTGILVARAIAPVGNTRFDSFEFYPHEAQFSDFTSTAYNLDIKPWNPVTNDLQDQIAIRYNPFPQEWTPLQVRSMTQGYGGSVAANNTNEALRPLPLQEGQTITFANTVDASIALTTYSPDVAPFIDMKKFNVMAVRHVIHDMGLWSSDVIITNPGAGYLANLQLGLISTTSGSPIVTGDANTNFATTLQVGDTVVIGGNVSVAVFSVTNSSQFIATANLSTTRAANTWFRYGVAGGNNAIVLTITGGNGSGANGYAIIGSDGQISSVVITPAGAGFTTTPTVTVPAPEAPGGSYTLSQTTGELVYNSELAPSGGNGLTRYITRPVMLSEGFNARDLVVYFDAYRPTGSQFYVYYKVLSGDADSSLFNDQPWRLMTRITSDSVVSTTYNQFKEFQFQTQNTRALDSSTDTTDKFKMFAVKVVMATGDFPNAPRITNFRAIALDT